MILHKAPEIHFCLMFLTEGSYLLLIIFCKTFPLGKIWRTVHVTKNAESGIRHEPAVVPADKIDVIFLF